MPNGRGSQSLENSSSNNKSSKGGKSSASSKSGSTGSSSGAASKQSAREIKNDQLQECLLICLAALPVVIQLRMALSRFCDGRRPAANCTSIDMSQSNYRAHIMCKEEGER